MTKSNFSIAIGVALVSLLLAGCGGSEVLMKPDYSNKIISSHRITDSRVKIVRAVDRRKSDSTTVGTGRVGMFEREVPYRLSVPVSHFVQNVMDSLFVTSSATTVEPAVVYVDSFEVGAHEGLISETAKVNMKMVFGIPVTPDSVLYIATRANEDVQTFSNATPLLEPMIYRGVVDCATQFIGTVRKMNVKFTSAQPNTVPSVLTAPPGTAHSAMIEGVALPPQPKYYDDIGIGYSTGGKITTGVRVYGDIMIQKDSSNTMNGFGVDIDVLMVNNKSAGIKGSLATYGGDFTLRQFFSGATDSPYFGLQGMLIFGSETIKYPDHQESSFFFGPYVRETLGISFNKKVYLEAGAYECALIGSKMLPTDLGFTCGLTFGI